METFMRQNTAQLKSRNKRDIASKQTQENLVLKDPLTSTYVFGIISLSLPLIFFLSLSLRQMHDS